MSSALIEAPQRWCDNCGRAVMKFHRFHKGKGYCSGCYPTEFLPVQCAGCQGIARVHRRDFSTPLCGGCRRAGRACVRCGKAVPTAGIRIGNDAVACPSCAPHFRDKEPCSNCGRLSSRLTWCGEGDLVWRVCDRCRNASTHATCMHCRRYRPVEGMTTQTGAAYCVDCGPSGVAWHDCPGCGIAVAGKGRGRCRGCLNRDRLKHDTRLIAATLSGAWTAELLDEFAGWLLERDGSSPKLPAILLSHASFFVSLDQAFDSSERLVPQAMLDVFTVRGLRRHLLPVRFLGDRIGLEISNEVKSEHVETSRIERIIDVAEVGGYSGDLICFNQWLIQDARPVRTRRLYLSAAARLIQSAGGVSLSRMEQGAVDRYLAKHPGARNDLGSVLRFTRSVLGKDISLPAAKTARTQLPKPVVQLRVLLKRAEDEGGAAPAALLQKIISVAMRIPPKAISAGKWWPQKRGRKWLLVSKTESIDCPPELHDILARWLVARS